MNASRAGFVVTSLLDNSLDAMLDRPSRVLTISTGTSGAFVFLEVRDTGAGISQDDVARLFTPFFTTKGEWAPSSSPQAKAKGVGLSLSVCRSTVAESGGRIEVESQPDVGTTFRVWLPIAERFPSAK
jgi:signal transduction histidine kinase